MLVGIVVEGESMRRAEIGTARRRSWWLEMLTLPETRAREFVKANATKVADVMTRHVVTATEDTPLPDLAALLEKNGIKRVPIVNEGRVIRNCQPTEYPSSADAECGDHTTGGRERRGHSRRGS